MSGGAGNGETPQPLRFGFIGFGRVGRKRAEVVAGLGHEVTAVFSPAPIDGVPPGASVAGSREQLLATPGLDAVVVAAYPVVAAGAVSAALEAGLHVFCEKPPGRSVADVERMAAAAARNPDRVLQFGFNHRHHPAIRAARRLVDAGADNGLGRVIYARGVYGKAGEDDFEVQWRSDPQLAGGGILTDQGIHLVDLLNWFCGPFTEVKSHVTNAFWCIPQEDNAAAILAGDGADGRSPCFATLHSSATLWAHRFELELGMSGGSIRVDGLLTASGTYGPETLTVLHRGARTRPEVVRFEEQDSWSREIAAFVAAARSGFPPGTGTLEDAWAAMSVVERIYENGRSASALQPAPDLACEP